MYGVKPQAPEPTVHSAYDDDAARPLYEDHQGNKAGTVVMEMNHHFENFFQSKLHDIADTFGVQLPWMATRM